MTYVTFNSLLMFMLYLVSGVVCLAVFTAIYLKVTPYAELKLIRAGKMAPAISLGGAMLGFILPVLSMSYVGVNFTDYMIWSIIACIVQLLSFKVMERLLPMNVDQDNQAISLVYFFASISIGAVNAFALIPH